MDATGEERQSVVDLTNDAALVRLLLDDTRLWRQRLTEELLFGAHDVVRLRSQYQLELTSGFLVATGLLQAPARSVRAILPLTTRPKASLLGFNISGPDGAPARLLPRRDIAAFEAEYLLELWESGPVAQPWPDEGLLEAITGFHWGRLRLHRVGGRRPEAALASYLTDNLRFEVPAGWVREWREGLKPVQEALESALGEPADPWSAAENPLMALASRVPRLSGLAEAQQIVSAYIEAVSAASAAGDIDFLEALGEYGRRWEVLVETEIVLDQPVVVTIAEDRRLDFTRGEVSVHLALGDAASYHLEARVSDHAVEFAQARYTDLDGEEIRRTELEDRRRTPHSLVLYSSIPTRSYYASLHVRLRLSRDQRVASWLVFGLVVLALGAATLGGFAGRVPEAMALLTVPTTFAATVVLTRPESPMAARLGLGFRRLLASLVFILWVVAIGRMLANDPPQGASVQPQQGLQSTVETKEDGHGEKRSTR